MNRREMLKKAVAGAAVLAVPAAAVAAASEAQKPYLRHYGGLGNGKTVTVMVYDRRYTLEEGYKDHPFAARVVDKAGKPLVEVKWNGDIMDFTDDELHPFSEGCHGLTCTEGRRLMYTVSVDPT
jgi:hypothetical protein